MWDNSDFDITQKAEDLRIARIREYLKTNPGSEYGPAHIVLSDYNIEDYWIKSVLESTELDDKTRQFLECLLEID